MKYKISPDRKTLTVFASKAERKELALRTRDGDDVQSDAALFAFFERLTGNSEIEWVSAGTTGDLTSAPMLGIYGEETAGHMTRQTHDALAWRVTGHDGTHTRQQPLMERWAFLDYAIRSPLEDLRDKGQAVFIS